MKNNDKEATKIAVKEEEALPKTLTHEEIVSHIKKAVSQIPGDLSKENKKKYGKLLLEIFEKGKTPKEAMNYQLKDLALIYNYAYSFYNKGQYKEAIELYKMLVTLDPTNPNFATCLGVCFHQLKQYESAITVYMLATEFSKNDPIPYYYLYDCFLKTGEKLAAAIMIARAIRECGEQDKFKKIKERSQKFYGDLAKELGADLTIKENQPATKKAAPPDKEATL